MLQLEFLGKQSLTALVTLQNERVVGHRQAQTTTVLAQITTVLAQITTGLAQITTGLAQITSELAGNTTVLAQITGVLGHALGLGAIVPTRQGLTSLSRRRVAGPPWFRGIVAAGALGFAAAYRGFGRYFPHRLLHLRALLHGFLPSMILLPSVRRSRVSGGRGYSNHPEIWDRDSQISR